MDSIVAPILTIFACPKAFHGHTSIIQQNAVRSWLQLRPQPKIILFGDDHGTEKFATVLGIKYISEIRRNQFGTPLVNDIFMQAQKLVDHKLLCYVNSDIIITGSLIHALEMLQNFQRPFLMVGRCWNLDINEELDFEHRECESRLEKLVKEKGRLRGPFNIDYCVFTSGLFDGIPPIPPFALGRVRWDNWVVWRALQSRASVVDASPVVQLIHQAHDYDHVPQGKKWSYRGPEAKLNQKLAGLLRTIHVYSILDATHRLTENGIEKRRRTLLLFYQLGLRTLYWLKERWPS